MYSEPETQTSLEKIPVKLAVLRLPSAYNKINQPVCNLKAGI
jgi:hypothetical protein